MQAILTLEYWMYFKEKWCCTAGKDPLFGHVDGFQIDPSIKKILPIFLAACAAPAEEITYRQINMDEVITLMEEESGYIILDVHTPEAFADKHIPGAINVPNETIGTQEIPELSSRFGSMSILALVVMETGRIANQAMGARPKNAVFAVL